MNDILNVLLDADYLQKQFDAHPRDMWAFTVLVFMVGIAIGFALSRLLKWSDRRRAESKRKEAERKKLMEWAVALDAPSKKLLLELTREDKGVVRLPADYDVQEAREKLSFEGESAVLLSHIGNDDDGQRVYSVRISDFGKRIVDEYGDIMAEAEEYE